MDNRLTTDTAPVIDRSDDQVYRALCPVSDWRGPIRASEDAARADAQVHRRTMAARGGFSRAQVVRPDPEAPTRVVDLDGHPVWPSSGRTSGSYRW